MKRSTSGIFYLQDIGIVKSEIFNSRQRDILTSLANKEKGYTFMKHSIDSYFMILNRRESSLKFYMLWLFKY